MRQVSASPATAAPPLQASTKAVSDASLWDQGPLLGPTSFWAALVFGSMLPMLMVRCAHCAMP